VILYFLYLLIFERQIVLKYLIGIFIIYFAKFPDILISKNSILLSDLDRIFRCRARAPANGASYQDFQPQRPAQIQFGRFPR